MARGDLGHYGEPAIGKIKNSADGMESSGNKKSLPLKGLWSKRKGSGKKHLKARMADVLIKKPTFAKRLPKNGRFIHAGHSVNQNVRVANQSPTLVGITFSAQATDTTKSFGKVQQMIRSCNTTTRTLRFDVACSATTRDGLPSRRIICRVMLGRDKHNV